MRILLLVLALLPLWGSAQHMSRMDGDYQGQLIYRDYTSGKLVPIGMRMRVETKGSKQTWHITYVEPNGEEIRDKAVLRYVPGATAFQYDGTTCQVEGFADNGTRLQLTFTSEGKDDGQPSTYRHVVQSTPDSLIVIKTVRQGDKTDWFERNRYRLGRVRP